MKACVPAIVAVLALGSPALADDLAAPPPQPKVRTPFDRGRFGLSLGAGSQNALGYHYFVVGGGVGYYVLDGVELGLSALHQFGDGPSISKVSPSLRYVAQPLVGKSPLIPYVGVFYNHWFIGSPYDDVDAVGARVGAVYISGQIVIGGGLVVEKTVSTCTMDCTSYYPDIIISIAL